VTEVHSKTVYEQTQLTYVDDAGNIEVIKTTDNHEFYVEGTGWTTAANLQQGDTLTLSDGRTALVTNTTTIAVPEGVTVYNLSVSDGSTYFVDDGQGSVSAAWVHNKIRTKRVQLRNDKAQRRLRQQLGLKRGDPRQAAHVVPVAFFISRSIRTIKSILQAKIVLARVKVPLTGKANAFRGAKGGHNGTHTDSFLQTLGPRLKNAYNQAKAQGKSVGEIRAAVVKELDKIKAGLGVK
jgi:hypothetical protein